MLHTQRLSLRRITESVAEGLFDIFSDDEVTRYYAFDTFTHPEQARDLALRSETQYQQREAMRWGLLRAGFLREGRLTERLWHRGGFHDVYMYGLTRTRWRTHPPAV